MYLASICPFDHKLVLQHHQIRFAGFKLHESLQPRAQGVEQCWWLAGENGGSVGQQTNPTKPGNNPRLFGRRRESAYSLDPSDK